MSGLIAAAQVVEHGPRAAARATAPPVAPAAAAAVPLSPDAVAAVAPPAIVPAAPAVYARLPQYVAKHRVHATPLSIPALQLVAKSKRRRKENSKDKCF